MKFTIKTTILGLVILATLSSCVSNKKYNELLSEKEALAQSLAESQEKIKMLEEEKNQLVEDNNELNSRVDKLASDLEATQAQIDEIKKMVEAKEKELQNMKSVVESAFADYEEAGLQVTGDGENLYISMPEKVLFRSGSARLDKSDKEIIKKLADILIEHEMSVVVEGHTDKKSMVEGAPYRDNWDLSVARSTTVVRQLIKDGVAPSSVRAAGAGEYHPAVTENPDSAETLQANRRTEFILTPNAAKLYELIKG
jgi:chemotaxis protein MotB